MTMRSGLWLAKEPAILASASITRRKLLEAAGIPVDVRPASIDERALEAALAGAAPGEVALALAAAKAMSVSLAAPDRLVLGADQVLALGDELLHKPLDRNGARQQLARLSGRKHQLHAALALARGGQVIWSKADSAALGMRQLGPRFIEAYLDAAGEAVLASVGAYQIESLGAHLFDLIEGDHSTILGLPLLPLLRALRQQGVLAQ